MQLSAKLIARAVISLCLIVFSIQNSFAQKGNLTIKGNIKLNKEYDRDVDECCFHYKDVLSGKDVIIPIRRDSLGNYQLSMQLENYQQIYFSKAVNMNSSVFYNTGMTYFSFFGKPGQTMVLNFTQKPYNLTFGGDFAKENQQYQDFDQALSVGTKNLYAQAQDRTMTAAEVKQLALNSFKEQLSFTKKYFAKHPASEFVKQQAYYYTLYRTQTAAIELNLISKNQVTDAMVSDFYQSIANTGRTFKDGPNKSISLATDLNPSLKNAGAIGNDEYKDMINSYYKVLDRNMPVDKEPTVLYKEMAAFALNRYPDITEVNKAVLQKILNDKVKLDDDEQRKMNAMMSLYVHDLLTIRADREQLANFFKIKDPALRDLGATMMLYKRLRTDQINTIDPLLDSYKKSIKNIYLKNKFLEDYEKEMDKLRNSKIPAGAILHSAVDFKGEGMLGQLLQKYKGKVIYLDIWATWCGPCIAAMPASQSLREKFKGQDVVFVYLCINSPDQTGWKNLIATHSINGEHYFLDQTQSSIIGRDLNIAFIPHYALIDKDGKLINKAATKPNEPDTFKQINKLLGN